jgi:DNA invertase Pin-like site-specific DNA recombinase
MIPPVFAGMAEFERSLIHQRTRTGREALNGAFYFLEA